MAIIMVEKDNKNQESADFKRGLVMRSLSVGQSRTSVRMEPLMWALYDEMIKREHRTQREVSAKVRELATHFDINFTAALRSYVTRYFYEAATEQGHLSAGHGTLPRHKTLDYQDLHRNMLVPAPD